MVNMMLWLNSLTHMRLRDSFVAHGHAMPICTTFIEELCVEASGFIGVNPQRLHAIGGSSVPISRGSPPLYSR
jgi:hypothetical protein